MKTKVLLVFISFWVGGFVFGNEKIHLLAKGTFISVFEIDNSFVYSSPDGTGYVGNSRKFLILQNGTQSDTVEYHTFSNEAILHTGDSLWVFETKEKRLIASNILDIGQAKRELKYAQKRNLTIALLFFLILIFVIGWANK